MVWTNARHHLHYHVVSVDTSGPFPLLNIQEGIWYHIHTVYFYLMLAMGMLLIISRFRKADRFIRHQNRIILLGALVPWIVNFLYLLRLRPFGHIDLTPFAFIASSLIISVGLLRFKLFDIVPIARGKIIEALQEGFLVLDVQSRIIDVNPQMRKIIGANPGNIIGKSISELFPSFQELVNAVDIPENHNLHIQLNNGRFYSITLTSLFEHQTIYSGKIMLFRDITERKQSEVKLKELNQLKDRLFSIISHDLRSPLLSLMDILSMTSDGTVSDEEFKSYLPTLAKNIGYTSGLVENLLQWSKSQLAGTVVNATAFDIKEMVTYVLNSYGQIATDKRIDLQNNIQGVTMVYADRDMIQAVLRNLVSNAIKFCHKGDWILISLEISTDSVMVVVADSGIGISEKNIGKLFGTNNFTTPGTTNERGTGLGLLLCKDFIEKNGGEIGVESKEGNGSRFYFTLPTAKAV